MSDQALLSVISICVASSALLVSFVTLWKAHLSRFTPIWLSGALTKRIYPIKSEDEKWFIASFGITLNVTNGGARAGVVNGLRLRVHFPELPIPENNELIFAQWDMEPAASRKIDKARFYWLDNLEITEWMPYVVLPKQTLTRHVLFETRWDDPVIQNKVHCTLQAQYGRDLAWKDIEVWELRMCEFTWSELTNQGTSISTMPKNSYPPNDTKSPPDLHKYTGSKKIIPENGFGAASSRVDYPD